MHEKDKIEMIQITKYELLYIFRMKLKIRVLLFCHQWRSGVYGKTISVGRNSKFMQNCGLLMNLIQNINFEEHLVQ